jgi:hypothetical protein
VLANQFDDQFVIISDLSVKTTYFTLCNLMDCNLPALTPDIQPLSNVALSLDKCVALIQVKDFLHPNWIRIRISS